jgi:hypothetical protein
MLGTSPDPPRVDHDEARRWDQQQLVAVNGLQQIRIKPRHGARHRGLDRLLDQEPGTDLRQ